MFALGTFINAGFVVLGGVLGLLIRGDLPAARQNQLRTGVGLGIILAGFHQIWTGFRPSGVGAALGLVGIALLATTLGRPLGRLLRVQAGMNRLGRWAGEQFGRSQRGEKVPFHDGFIACAILFCVGPLSVLGPLQEGLDGNFVVLAVKAVMDGLAAFAFARAFSAGVILAGLPLVALQGSILLVVAWAAQAFLTERMGQSLHVTGGLLVVCSALLVFDVKKVELGDFLPALLVAPALAWLFF